MICQAAVFTRRLLSGDELTQEELMQMEIAVRKGCPYQKIFIDQPGAGPESGTVVDVLREWSIKSQYTIVSDVVIPTFGSLTKEKVNRSVCAVRAK